MRQANIIGNKTLSLIDHSNFQNFSKSVAFSPNLRSFLRKNPHMTQIFIDKEEHIWYIGYKDDMNNWCGAKFISALCFGTQTPTFSHPRRTTDRLEERTHQFWKCTEHFGRRMFARWYLN